MTARPAGLLRVTVAGLAWRYRFAWLPVRATEREVDRSIERQEVLTVVTLLTFGHGTASQEQLTQLLTASGVCRVVDVRRYPGSRRHPHVAAVSSRNGSQPPALSTTGKRG